MNNLRQSRRRAENQDKIDNLIPARVGAVVNGANAIPVNGMPAWIYVTLMKGDKPGPWSIAICHKVNPRWWLPVLMSVNKDGSYYIERTDPNRINMFNSGSTAGIANSDDIGPHNHNDGALTDVVPAERLAFGRVSYQNDGPYILHISSFFYYDVYGVRKWFSGDSIDFATSLTLTAGQIQLVLISFDTLSGLLVSTIGDPVASGSSVSKEDMANLSIGDNEPLGAVVISYADPISSVIDCSIIKTRTSAVGSVHLVGQTAAIPDTDILTPFSDGQYQAQIVLTDTTAGISGTIDATITWTDYNGVQTATTSAITISGTGKVDTIKSIYAKSTGPIRYRVDFHSVVGSPAFAVDIKILRMG